MVLVEIIYILFAENFKAKKPNTFLFKTLIFFMGYLS